MAFTSSPSNSRSRSRDSNMARFSVGGDDYGTCSRSRRPLPKRPRTQSPSLTLTGRNVPLSSTSNSAMRPTPDRFISEEEESDDQIQSESGTSSHNTFDSRPESEERGGSPRYSPSFRGSYGGSPRYSLSSGGSYGESPRYSYSPFLEEEEEVHVEEDEVQPAEARDNGYSSQSGTRVMLADPDVLDCPICLDPLSPPVYQCENGHLACCSCTCKTGNRCPSCSMPIGHNRCRGIEKVLESAKASCQNRQRGCMVKISYGKKLQHEKLCKYAGCSCPIRGCNYVNVYKRLYTHFTAQHSHYSRKFSFNASFWFQLRKDDTKVFLEERNEGVLFILNRIIVPLGSLVNVICVAPAYSDEEYTYELTANAGEKSIMLKTFVEVTPKWDPEESPKKNCLVITSDFADCRDDDLRLDLVIRRAWVDIYT